MKNITIKKDRVLIELSIKLGRSPDLLIEEMLTNAQKENRLTDDVSFDGKLLVDCFIKKDLYTKEGACVFCINSHDDTIVKLFCQIKLIKI